MDQALSRLTMLCILLLLIARPLYTATEPTCDAGDDLRPFCEQTHLSKHEVRFNKGTQSPSYCFYGDYDSFVPDETVRVKRCGWEGLDQKACNRAGCCYKEGMCYRPIRAAEVDTFFENTWVSFATAQTACAEQGMSLFCAQHDDDLEFMSRAACGMSWLGGELAPARKQGKKKFKLLPFKEPSTCFQEGRTKGTTCERKLKEHGLSFERANEEDYYISALNSTHKRNLFCAKQVQAPILETFPNHVEFEDEEGVMECGLNEITFDGRGLLESNLTWTITDGSGKVVRTVSRLGNSSDSIYPEEVGIYTCRINLLLAPGLVTEGGRERRVEGHAYHYKPFSFAVRISISSSSEVNSRIDRATLKDGDVYKLLLGDKIHLDIECEGFPYPSVGIVATLGDGSQRDDQFLLKDDLYGGRVQGWVYERFGEDVWIYEKQYTEVVDVTFSSIVDTKVEQHIQFTLIKTYIVLHLDSSVRDSDLALNQPHRMQCYGYGTGSLHEAEASWLCNGREFADLGIKFSVVDDARGIIEVIPTSSEYSGEYQCLVDNGAAKVGAKFFLRVQAAPDIPISPTLDQGWHNMDLEIPISEDPWEMSVYNVSMVDQEGTVWWIALEVQDNGTNIVRLDYLSDSENYKAKKEVPTANIESVYRTTTTPQTRATLKLQKSPAFNFIDNNEGTNRTIKLVVDVPGNFEESKYYITYTVTNEWGTSEPSPNTFWTVYKHELEFPAPKRVKINNCIVVSITNDSIQFRVGAKKVDSRVSWWEVFYKQPGDEGSLQSVRVDGSRPQMFVQERKFRKHYLAFEVNSLKNGTWYLFYVQAFVHNSADNSTKKSEVGGACLRKLTRNTYPPFDKDTWAPQDMIVSHIDSRGDTDTGIVLVRWKFPHDRELVSFFNLKVKIGKEEDYGEDDEEDYGEDDEEDYGEDDEEDYGSDYEEDDDAKLMEGSPLRVTKRNANKIMEVNITSTASSYFINDLRLDQLYRFVMRTKTGRRFSSATIKSVKLSEARFVE